VRSRCRARGIGIPRHDRQPARRLKVEPPSGDGWLRCGVATWSGEPPSGDGWLRWGELRSSGDPPSGDRWLRWGVATSGNPPSGDGWLRGNGYVERLLRGMGDAANCNHRPVGSAMPTELSFDSEGFELALLLDCGLVCNADRKSISRPIWLCSIDRCKYWNVSSIESA